MDLCTSVSLRRTLYPSWIGSSDNDYCSRSRLNKAHLSADAPIRKFAQNSRIVLFVRAKSKTRKALKEALEREKAIQREQRELLAQVRSRKKLTWLQREQALSQDDCEVEKVWPFWRKKKKAELKARALTKKIIELSKKQQLDQVFKLLEEAKKEDSWTPNLIIMNTVVAACVNCHDVDRAFQVYEGMIGEIGCGVDNVTYGTLLRGLGEARRLDDAFELVETIVGGKAPGNPKLTDVHLNTLVNACVEAGDPLRARGVLLRYRSSVPRTSPSTLTYNLLIKGCARSDKPLEALKLKEEMITQGLQPQRLTYNSLMYACVKGGDMDQAFQLLEEMKHEARRLNTSKLLPDVVTYTTLLKGADDIDVVLNLVAEMKRSPTCVMDRIAYTAIVDACISAGAPQDGLRFLEEMKELAKSDSQMRPKSHVFLALMRAFAEARDIEMVKVLKQQMVPLSAGNVSAEDRAQADELLIEAAVNLGQIGLARHMLRTMVGLKKGIPLTDRANTVLVRLQALLGFGDNLFKPYMLQPGISPYETVETIMIPYKEARPLLADLELKQVVMRFLKEDAIPVIDKQGACIGVVYSEDIFEMDVRIRDVMRGPPPDVTSSTLIYRAVGLLLNPQVKLLAVVSSRTAYSTIKSSSSAIPLGFIARDTIFSLAQYRLRTSHLDSHFCTRFLSPTFPFLTTILSIRYSSPSKMPVFEHEIDLNISASAMWAAMKDQNTVFPKIMPEAIASIDIVDGEGGPGSTRIVKFGSMVPNGGFVKERIVSLDIEGRSVVSEEVEGGHLAQFGFTKWVQTLTLISTGESTSKLHVSAEFEGGSEESIAQSNEISKQGITNTFKALEQYVKSSS